MPGSQASPGSRTPLPQVEALASEGGCGPLLPLLPLHPTSTSTPTHAHPTHETPWCHRSRVTISLLASSPAERARRRLGGGAVPTPPRVRWLRRPEPSRRTTPPCARAGRVRDALCRRGCRWQCSQRVTSPRHDDAGRGYPGHDTSNREAHGGPSIGLEALQGTRSLSPKSTGMPGSHPSIRADLWRRLHQSGTPRTSSTSPPGLPRLLASLHASTPLVRRQPVDLGVGEWLRSPPLGVRCWRAAARAAVTKPGGRGAREGSPERRGGAGRRRWRGAAGAGG